MLAVPKGMLHFAPLSFISVSATSLKVTSFFLCDIPILLHVADASLLFVISKWHSQTPH